MITDNHKLNDALKSNREKDRIINELRAENQRLTNEIEKWKKFVDNLGANNPFNDPWKEKVLHNDK